MAVAGRVAIVPKGEWSSTITYKKLDFVKYNNSIYIAKKESTNILPTNEEYWMLSISGITNTITTQEIDLLFV